MADSMTGRRHREKRGTVLEVALPPGVWRVNVHEMEVMIGRPERAAEYLDQRVLRSSVIGLTAPRE
jgi:hypothetical protein